VECVLRLKWSAINPARLPASDSTTDLTHIYLSAMILQLLPQLHVLLLHSLQLALQLQRIHFHGRTQILLDVVDGIVGLIALLVETHQSSG
jgi:hypothetical protein